MALRNYLYFAFQIKDGLFIGDINSPSERDFLLSNQISAVVNCASSQIKPVNLNIGLKFINFDWLDNDEQIILDQGDQNMDSIYQFMQEAIQNCQSILICSVRGQSRALTVITAFLMKKFKWSMYKTLQYMNSKRSDFQIRATFLQQLLNYEVRIFGQNLAGCSRNWKDDSVCDWDGQVLQNTYVNSQPSMAIQDQSSNQNENQLSKGKAFQWNDNIREQIPYFEIFDREIVKKNEPPKPILKLKSKKGSSQQANNQKMNEQTKNLGSTLSLKNQEDSIKRSMSNSQRKKLKDRIDSIQQSIADSSIPVTASLNPQDAPDFRLITNSRTYNDAPVTTNNNNYINQRPSDQQFPEVNQQQSIMESKTTGNTNPSINNAINGSNPSSIINQNMANQSENSLKIVTNTSQNINASQINQGNSNINTGNNNNNPNYGNLNSTINNTNAGQNNLGLQDNYNNTQNLPINNSAKNSIKYEYMNSPPHILLQKQAHIQSQNQRIDKDIKSEPSEIPEPVSLFQFNQNTGGRTYGDPIQTESNSPIMWSNTPGVRNNNMIMYNPPSSNIQTNVGGGNSYNNQQTPNASSLSNSRSGTPTTGRKVGKKMVVPTPVSMRRNIFPMKQNNNLNYNPGNSSSVARRINENKTPLGGTKNSALGNSIDGNLNSKDSDKQDVNFNVNFNLNSLNVLHSSNIAYTNEGIVSKKNYSTTMPANSTIGLSLPETIDKDSTPHSLVPNSVNSGVSSKVVNNSNFRKSPYYSNKINGAVVNNSNLNDSFSNTSNIGGPVLIKKQGVNIINSSNNGGRNSGSQNRSSSVNSNYNQSYITPANYNEVPLEYSNINNFLPNVSLNTQDPQNMMMKSSLNSQSPIMGGNANQDSRKNNIAYDQYNSYLNQELTYSQNTQVNQNIGVEKRIMGNLSNIKRDLTPSLRKQEVLHTEYRSSSTFDQRRVSTENNGTVGVGNKELHTIKENESFYKKRVGSQNAQDRDSNNTPLFLSRFNKGGIKPQFNQLVS